MTFDLVNRLPGQFAAPSVLLFGLVLALVLAGCSPADPSQRMAMVRTHLEQQDIATALIEGKNLVQSHPDLPGGRFWLGRALLAGGDLAGAETEFQRARELGHPEDDVAPAHAELLLARGDAAEVVTKYKSRRPGEALAAATLSTLVAQAELELGRLGDAEATIGNALVLAPQHLPAWVLRARVAMAQGDVPTARRIADEWRQKAPEVAIVHTLQGDLLQRIGSDFDGAASAYRKAIQLQGRLPEPHLGLVRLELRRQDLKAAEAAAEAMRSALPASPSTLYAQALVAYAQKRYARTREQLQRLLRGQRPAPEVAMLAGMTEWRLGGLVQAESLLTLAMQGLPNDPHPRRELAGLYVQLARPAAALEVLKPLLAGPADAGAWRIAAQAHALAGEFGPSDAAFARARQLAPADPRLKVDMARAQIARGEADAGLRELQAAAAQEKDGVDAHLALVAAHMRLGDAARALEVVSGLQQRHPTHTVPDLLRARILVQKGEPAAARQAYEAALAKNPASLAAIEGLATLDVTQGAHEAARRRYEQLLERQPKSTAAMMALADLSRRRGDLPDQAAAWVDRAVTAEPQNAALWRAAVNFHRQSGDAVRALARARAALAALPDHPDVLTIVSEAQLAAGDRQQAVSTLNRLVQLRPNEADGFNRLARAHLAAGDLGAARRHASMALRLSPDWPPALRTLQAVMAAEPTPTAAGLELARGVQGRLPGLALGWELEGEWLALRGNWTAAAQAFRTAVKKQASSAGAIRLHDALSKGEGTRAAAADWAHQWLAEHPGDVAFQVHLAQSAMARQDWRTAAARYRQALKLQPGSAALMNDLAYVLVQMYDREALPLAQQAAKAMPFIGEVADTLSRAHESQGQIGKAIESQARAVALMPGDPRLRLRLARLQLSVGDKSKAAESLVLLERQSDPRVPQDEVRRMLQQARD